MSISNQKSGNNYSLKYDGKSYFILNENNTLPTCNVERPGSALDVAGFYFSNPISIGSKH